MKQIRLYVQESFDELFNHVTWPTWPSLQSTTVLVLVATFILSAVILSMDALSKVFTEFVYGL